MSRHRLRVKPSLYNRETVYDDLIQFYEIDVDKININKDLAKNRLKSNLRYRDRLITDLNR
jgi:hypothetical protein